MGKAKFLPAAFAGVIHHYTPRLVAFEFGSSVAAQNTIIWISGLTEGLLCPSYPKAIATALKPSWSISQVILSSSYSGWGTSSLLKDAKELSQCISYFRSIKNGKIVLMGHSTGCQDVMEYLVGPGRDVRPKIDGGILQAGISDREAMVHFMKDGLYQKSVKTAQEMIADGRGEEIMPTASTGGFFGDPCCARRWLSLASPDGKGADDYFSSDLKDEQLKESFGRIPTSTPISILYSGNDEHVPEHIDKQALVTKWLSYIKASGGVVNESFSGLIAGASHNYLGNPDEVVQELVRKVVGFVTWIEQRDRSKL